MALVFGEQHGTLPEIRQAISRPIENAGHTQRIRLAAPPEDPEVGIAEIFRIGCEVNPVGRQRDFGLLAVARHRSVVVHPDFTIPVVHVDVRRGEVSGRVGVVQVQHPGFVGGPRTREPVRKGKADILAPMVAEIEIVPAEGVREPLWDPDERWTVDVVTHPGVHMRTDDGVVRQSFDAH